MSVIISIQSLKFVGMFMFYLHTTFHIPSSTVSSHRVQFQRRNDVILHSTKGPYQYMTFLKCVQLQRNHSRV
jgi:hypothetical protein